MITYADFQKLELKIGEIKTAEKVVGADKLLRLTVSLGDEERQVVAGIASSYQPEEVIGKRIVFLANLEPKAIRGVESNGMVLAADNNGSPILLHPGKEVPVGSKVK